MIKLLQFIGLLAAVAYLLSVDAPAAQPAKQPKPAAETCLSPDPKKWSAAIEEQSDGGWACVMRRLDSKGVKVFFYGKPLR